MEMLGLVISFLNYDWVEKVIGGVVVFYFARREVRNQFGAVNENLDRIAKELKVFGTRIVELETKHDARITRVENDLKVLSKDVIEIKLSKTVNTQGGLHGL